MKVDVEGAPGKKWYLNIGIEITEGQLSNQEVLLGGFASIPEVLFETVPGFTIPTLKEDSPLEDLTLHLVEDGFPTSASIALQYFQTKKQNGGNSNSASTSPKAPAASPRTPSSVSKNQRVRRRR